MYQLIIVRQQIPDPRFILFTTLASGDSFYFLDPDGYRLEIHTGNWHSRVEYLL